MIQGPDPEHPAGEATAADPPQTASPAAEAGPPPQPPQQGQHSVHWQNSPHGQPSQPVTSQGQVTSQPGQVTPQGQIISPGQDGGWPAPAPVVQWPVVQPPAGRGRLPWLGIVALTLVVVLGAAVGVQTWRLGQVTAELSQTVERLDGVVQDQTQRDQRLGALEERTEELERSAGEAFNPETIADAVLPSVFKVVAGDFTGTAFAMGDSADDGGTNLFTNYHVVEQVWLRDDREVFLERGSERFPAEIVDADRSADVAWLHTTSSFTGLAAAGEEVRTGQPIVSVGAPLGLGDTLTTGVVSNTARHLPDGSGPWIQFDAAVEPGNSGGPVINARQQVVGITTRKATDFDGIGFAVPIAEACELFDIC
jgi:putative serine protease PepD